MNKYIVGGVGVHSLTCNDLAELCLHDFYDKNQRNPKLVFSMNGEGISSYHTSKRFRELIGQADVVHPDGMSTVLAGRHFTNGVFPERVATTDAFHNLARMAEREGLKFFFLGGKPESNARALVKVKEQYPDLIISGSQHGYFEKSEESKVIEKIVASEADVVWVGLGRPLQEEWCVKNRRHLPQVTWLKTCGGLFDFLSESKVRAPLWMQKFGLEWLFRLILEPRRLLWRYTVTNIHSIYCYVFRSRR